VCARRYQRSVMVLAWRGNGPVVVSSSGKREVWRNITIRAWYFTVSV
jgi:hypothetical protein